MSRRECPPLQLGEVVVTPIEERRVWSAFGWVRIDAQCVGVRIRTRDGERYVDLTTEEDR